MDRHHPAYWLNRDPAEAALFLSRTAVASRTVGGFVKTADGLPPGMQDTLTHAAIGAGLGGLGGLGVGLFSRRRKNPLTTALTGAALGGVLGGALPPAYEALKGLGQPAGITAAQAELAGQEGKTFRDMPWYQQLYYKLPWASPPPIDPAKMAPKTPVPKTPLDVEKEQATWGRIGAKGVKDVGTGAIELGRDVTGIKDRPWTASTIQGAGALGSGAMWQARRQLRAFRELEAGAAAMAPNTAAGRAPAAAVTPTGGTPRYAQRLRSAANILTTVPGNPLDPRRLGTQMGRGWDIMRREGQVGPGLRGLNIKNLRAAGRTALGPRTTGSYMRGGAMNLLPYLASLGISKLTEPE